MKHREIMTFPLRCVALFLILILFSLIGISGASDNRNLSIYYRGTFSESIPTGLGKKLTTALPPFAPVNARDPLCRNHSRIYLQELEKFSLWALKMHDATAKLPSGLLNGNVNQLGDFDQCLEIRNKFDGDEIKGQYCLTSIQLRLHSGHGPTMEQIYTLVQSHSAFKSNLEDPGHRVPRFSSINWAVCIPSSCGAADVEETLLESLEHHLGPTGLRIQVQVTPEMCQTQQETSLPPNSSLLVLGFFLVMLGVACAATILDYGMKDQPPTNKVMEIFLSFSFKLNCKKLFSLDRPPNDIPSIHGIRTLNAMMLLVAHKSMALFFIPYVNRTAMSECLGKPWTVVGRAASLYTDPFIMLSGLLTSYAFLRHLNRSQALDIPKEILSRLMRLVPTLSALILFCTFILPVMGSGPMWNLVIRHHAELCKVSWWRNLLFIHNYYGFKNMCLTHTHHVGIDTQLFIISPILVKVIWRWPKPGFIALLILALYSTVLRFYVTYVKQLSLFLYFGNPISQMFNTADLSYILPTHRLSVYIIGVALGYGLHYWGRDYKMKTGHLTFGWFVALVMLYQSILGPAKMGDRNYVYDRMDAANYAAFAPITWCLFFAWIIFCGYTGNGGLLSKFFSWKGFLICTRLSYSFYLTQFPVFFYFVGLLRAPIHYSFYLLFDMKELTVIIIASVILTLMFEMPFQNIRSILLKKPSSTIPSEKPLSARL